MIAPNGPLRPDPGLVPALRRRTASDFTPSGPAPHEDSSRGRREEDGITPTRRLWLRVLFALDIVGAGAPGVLMLATPEKAGELLFTGDLTPDAGTRVLGCIWVALGLLSIAGLARPVRFSPVLLVQLAYKAIWLLCVGLPAVAAGDAVPPLLAAIFAGWVVAVGLTFPWRIAFASEIRPARAVLPQPR